MGRLTLNVLLSFAQFEREVIGERVRDKIAASKRKGIWAGGPVPLGYRSIGKKPAIVPEEAETVRFIFTRYLELGSLGALLEELDRRGIRTKACRLTGGRVRGDIRFGAGSLAYLLKNRFYIGEIGYRGEVHRGEHEPILDRHLFEAVQAQLAANAVARRLQLKGTAALLTGRIFDDRGSRMSQPMPTSGGCVTGTMSRTRFCRSKSRRPGWSRVCRVRGKLKERLNSYCWLDLRSAAAPPSPRTLRSREPRRASAV